MRLPSPEALMVIYSIAQHSRDNPGEPRGVIEVRDTILDALIAEAERQHEATQRLADHPESLDSETRYGPLFYVADDPWYSGSMGWMVAQWLRSMKERAR